MTDFTFHTLDTASADAKPILETIQHAYGFMPNLFAFMAEAPTTLEAYLSLNQLVEKTSLTSSQQQIALLAASVQNECEFCTVAHRAIGKMKNANQQSLDALHSNNEISDASDAELVSFTKAMVKSRGRVTDTDINNFLKAGFTKQNIFEVVLIVSIKTLSNYINHMTNPEPNAELLSML